jgi:hypothetical protein
MESEAAKRLPGPRAEAGIHGREKLFYQVFVMVAVPLAGQVDRGIMAPRPKRSAIDDLRDWPIYFRVRAKDRIQER